jgi:hypothetical protein
MSYLSTSLVYLRKCLLVAILAILVPIFFANAELSKTTDEVNSFIKPDWNSTEKNKILISVKKVSEEHFSVNAKMYVKADTKAFFTLLESAGKDCSWLASCKKITILDKSLPQFRYVHTVFSSPWPAKDREMYTRSEHVFHPETQDLSILISDISDQYPDTPGVLKLKGVSAQWSMTHQFGPWYELNYLAEATVGGWIPSWLSKNLLISSTEKTFKGIRERLH